MDSREAFEMKGLWTQKVEECSEQKLWSETETEVNRTEAVDGLMATFGSQENSEKIINDLSKSATAKQKRKYKRSFEIQTGIERRDEAAK